jgi:hypothetical protein
VISKSAEYASTDRLTLNTNSPAEPNPDPRLTAIVLASATEEPCKVALLIARATDAARAQSIEASAQDIAAAIYALAADKGLDVTGNVRRWRSAEVRLPLKQSAP